MDPSEWERLLFNLILHAGESRSNAKEAAEFASEGKWEEAQACMDEANKEQLEAHKVSTQIIKMEAQGERVDFSILLVHALDLLLLAWSEIDFTEQFIRVNKRVKALEDEVALWRD
jgi:PTS system cellobiose-specific IIA component